MNSKSNLTTLFFLTLTFVLTATFASAQTPAPAIEVQFALPLADKTTATAVLLPTTDGQAWLVYATPIGKIGLYLLTPTNPTPPPEPTPPIPPVPPPVPTRLTIAIVENPSTTTQEQRGILSDSTWRDIAKSKHDFIGIIPNDIRDARTGLPPVHLVPFLNRAKLHRLPWVMFTDGQTGILWEGELPNSSAAFSALISKYGTYHHAPPNCFRQQCR